jgi:hypothetical protein
MKISCLPHFAKFCVGAQRAGLVLTIRASEKSLRGLTDAVDLDELPVYN